MYAIFDMAQAIPGINVANSKSMGGLAVMLGGAAVDWKSWRFHTVVVDSTSGEMLAGSRAATKMYYYRRVAGFCGLPQDRPSPMLCDNDGVWFIAKDATGTTSLIYIIRHVFVTCVLFSKVRKRASFILHRWMVVSIQPMVSLNGYRVTLAKGITCFSWDILWKLTKRGFRVSYSNRSSLARSCRLLRRRFKWTPMC